MSREEQPKAAIDSSEAAVEVTGGPGCRKCQRRKGQVGSTKARSGWEGNARRARSRWLPMKGLERRWIASWRRCGRTSTRGVAGYHQPIGRPCAMRSPAVCWRALCPRRHRSICSSSSQATSTTKIADLPSAAAVRCRGASIGFLCSRFRGCVVGAPGVTESESTGGMWSWCPTARLGVSDWCAPGSRCWTCPAAAVSLTVGRWC